MSLILDQFVSPEFYVEITPVILCLVFHNIYTRNRVIKWLVMILGSISALYGTFQSQFILTLASYFKSPDFSTDSYFKSHDLSTDSYFKSPELLTTNYLTYLLLYCIACIVIDGRLAVSLLSRHRQKMLVCRDFRRELGKYLFKISAMVTSCLAMLSLSYYVYTSFNGLTEDLCLHICFLAAVVVRNIRIICQGTVESRSSELFFFWGGLLTLIRNLVQENLAVEKKLWLYFGASL